MKKDGEHTVLSWSIIQSVGKVSLPSLFFSYLQIFSGENILFHVSELGKKPPVFADSSAIAQEILDSGFEFDVGKMIYNKFK